MPTHCAQCDMPIEQPSPSDLCVECRIERGRPNSIHARVRAMARERRMLIVELGMPADAVWKRLVYNGAIYGDQWRDYSAEMFGIVVPELPCPPPWPYMRQVYDNGRYGIIVQLWLRRIRHKGTPAFIEARWHPERGETIALVGLESTGSIASAEKALKGIKFLKRLDERGRKPGRDEKDFPRRLLEAYDELVGQYASVSQCDVATWLGTSRATFGRQLKDHGIEWHKFKAAYWNDRNSSLENV